MEHMPSGAFEANTVFFSIGVLAYNLHLGFHALVVAGADGETEEKAEAKRRKVKFEGAHPGFLWRQAQNRSILWKLYQTPGKACPRKTGMVTDVRPSILKVSADLLDLFTRIRAPCAKLQQEGGLINKTS